MPRRLALVASLLAGGLGLHTVLPDPSRAHDCVKVIVLTPTTTILDPMACHDPPGPAGHECNAEETAVGTTITCTTIVSLALTDLLRTREGAG